MADFFVYRCHNVMSVDFLGFVETERAPSEVKY